MGVRVSVTSMGVAAVLGLAACNGLAGLDAFHEVDHYADASSDASDPDAPTVEGGSDPDAIAAPESASGCYDLTVEVGSDSSGQFDGVIEKNGNVPKVPLHQSRTACLASGTRIELQASPDLSGHSHVWTGPCTDPSRRCLFTMTQTTMVHVELQ